MPIINAPQKKKPATRITLKDVGGKGKSTTFTAYGVKRRKVERIIRAAIEAASEGA